MALRVPDAAARDSEAVRALLTPAAEDVKVAAVLVRDTPQVPPADARSSR